MQVAGALATDSSSYDDATGLLRFTLRDDKTGETLPVRYHGLRPANFEDAISIVAIGIYDAPSGELAADKLLVKCPSKYQGAGSQRVRRRPAMDYLSHLYLPGRRHALVRRRLRSGRALGLLAGAARRRVGAQLRPPRLRLLRPLHRADRGGDGHPLVRRDFRIEYVFQYSGLDLPVHYQLAAFWAGQKGSFLIWLLWGSLLGLPLMRTAGKAEAPVMGIYSLTLLGLLFILVRENPFVMLGQTPADGQGLNPLLQDNWMVIHPPIMFIGYASSAVPFAFAMAALWRRDYDELGGARLPLGAGRLPGARHRNPDGRLLGLQDPRLGRLLGLGSGRERLAHPLALRRRADPRSAHGAHPGPLPAGQLRARDRLVYMSVLYGTFLTRSGVLADFSVHSFVDLGISGWLIALMACSSAHPALPAGHPLREIPATRNEDPLLSRGSFLVLSTIAIAVAGAGDHRRDLGAAADRAS